jgi:hypothetical protein
MAGRPDMAGQPLVVGDLAPGTVSVRVGRGSLSNRAVGVKVVATVSGPGQEARTLTATTGADGRAVFENLAPGSLFQAEAELDGERLRTTAFAVPGEGGARLMLVSRGQAGAPASASPSGGAGAAAPAVPPPGHQGATEPAATPAVPPPGHQGATEPAATPAAPPPGHQGATEPAAGHGAAPLGAGPQGAGSPHVGPPAERTSDRSVLRPGAGSRLVIDLREEALAVMENLVIDNTSDRLFDPGRAGLALPLPDGATGVEAIEGGVPLEVKGSELRLTGAIAPRAGQLLGSPERAQARFGFYLPTAGRPEIELRQPMPLGLPEPLLLVPESARLRVEAAGLRVLPPQTDDANRSILMYQLPSVPPGGILRVRLGGLPVRGRTGKQVAGVLCAALLLAGMLGAGRRGKRGGAAANDEREGLLVELTELERASRKEGTTAERDARRAELLAALRESYGQVRSTRP